MLVPGPGKKVTNRMIISRFLHLSNGSNKFPNLIQVLCGITNVLSA